MKRSIWGSLFLVIVVAALSVAALNSWQPGAAQSDAPDWPGASSQGTEAQIPFDASSPLDDQSLFPEAATARFYHIPGSTLTPVTSATTLSYDGYGCVHATAGASNLLNAPLEIPHGSQIVLLRIYYDDTSASNLSSWITRYNDYGTSYQDLVAVTSLGNTGHGSNYGDLDHIVNTYDYSYVLNVALGGVTTNALQICGIRVMYYPPFLGLNFLPSIFKNSDQ